MIWVLSSSCSHETFTGTELLYVVPLLMTSRI
jgi:hypothetical protein